MITFGLYLMICTALPLAGLLSELHSRAIQALHDRVIDEPLSPAGSLIERHHLTRPCATCSMVAQMVVTRRG